MVGSGPLFRFPLPHSYEKAMQKIPCPTSLVLSVIALVLLFVNISLVAMNRSTQAKIGQQQSDLAAGQPIVQLHQALVRMMADATVKSNDSQMKELLESQGISLKKEANQAPAPAPAPAPVPEE